MGGCFNKDRNLSPSTGLEVMATHTMAKPLRLVSTKESISFAGLEVGMTSNKLRRVHYSEDSNCGLFSDSSHEMEDKDNIQEEELEEKNHEVIPELETTNPTTDTEDEEEL